MDTQKCIAETIEHINNVRLFIRKLITDLHSRAYIHDISKLENPELSGFTEFTPKLAKSTFGSDEYKQFLIDMKPFLDHHYANNRHHPEYFEEGIRGMTLVDLIEMLCDWKAATLRHNNGDILKSIEYNQKRFGFSGELKQIFINTVNEYLT